MDEEEIKFWVWLSKIDGIGPIKTIELLKKFEISKLWDISKEELICEGISPSTAEKIVNEQYKFKLDNYLKYMKDNNIKIVPIVSKKYPNKLKQIYDPPMVLYVRGNEDILRGIGIAVIGCRLCTTYGKQIAKEFSYLLATNNINVISGLAIGIDTYAHVGAVEAKKPTIAVIGSGLDIIYPAQNKELVNQIIKNDGAIVSEYIVGTKPTAMNFPARNRIISGLSNGILVVEAKKKSGTIITVDFGLEQGKEIYIVPGNINSVNSEGTNDLIKQGAKIVTNIDDILTDINNG
ncbi:MAG: DNA-processing protein DprA [Lachnospiraceae bacterium]|jgi:DNA processing protein|nr:DNA-processing protein DprA [Lachnospiraceae bacterium]